MRIIKFYEVVIATRRNIHTEHHSDRATAIARRDRWRTDGFFADAFIVVQGGGKEVSKKL